MILLVYEQDTLTYWSDHNTPATHLPDTVLTTPGLHFAGNGWYETMTPLRQDKRLWLLLILIRNEYPYQNQYLVNAFQKDFKVHQSIEISREKGEFEIFNYQDQFLLSLVFPDEIPLSPIQSVILLIIYLICFFFIIAALWQGYLCLPFINERPWLLFFAFSFDVIIIRAILFFFRLPRVLYHTALFSPASFAFTPLLPSLGDLLVNSLILMTIAAVFFKRVRPGIKSHRKETSIRIVLLVIYLAFIFMLFSGILVILNNLILHSGISFDLNDINSLSYMSFTGMAVFTILVFSMYLFTQPLLKGIALLIDDLQVKSVSIPILFMIAFLLSGIWITGAELIPFAALILYICIAVISEKQSIRWFRPSAPVLYLIIASILSTYILYSNHSRKEAEARKIYSLRIADERDPLAEYLYGLVRNRLLLEDTLFFDLCRQYSKDIINEEELKRYILTNFDHQYWKKYRFQITVCDSSRLLDIMPSGLLANCYDFFRGMITTNGQPTGFDSLYYLEYQLENDNYLGIIKPLAANNIDICIFVEFFSKYIPKGLGYPELLMDDENSNSGDLSRYSWARYENGELAVKFGKYFYSIHLNNYNLPDSSLFSFDRNGYNHLVVRPDGNSALIISSKLPGIFEIIAPFSYFFVFFGVFVLLFQIFLGNLGELIRSRTGFRKRLQASIISLIVVSFFLTGMFSLWYIISLNDSRNQDILSEKAHSVLIELEHKLAAEEQLTPETQNYLADLLYKFSLVFFSDINIYDLNGNLIATSRPEIFDRGLISRKMEPLAFNKMSFEKKTLLIEHERIGQYKYLSAYLPFRNDRNKLIAFLNLPYFARQEELTGEISNILVAFINIYVILIAIAVLTAVFVSNYISRPLQLIREKIGHLRLGKTNEKIEWGVADEIGSLVEEYNRMVDELAKSAELLARSERETAWREMARQVAHEIKNPLTPMKLSVQYLKKAWDEKASDWERRLQRFSQTIIEQIDALSVIASAFSDFARMPASRVEPVNLIPILRSAIDLFRESDGIRIEAVFPEEYGIVVLVDREQILRVFNNLIKNSVQAIRDPEHGRISISMKVKFSDCVIEFSDNGIGIPEAQKDRVFSPNFTTKSSGMGLGLAIAHNVITEAGGEITFTSQEGKGTTFIVKLPLYKPQA
ncbi:MAG: hypothetical protein JW861_05755 [Bacteroidales bacterium]|nr:hypothetical protein [Bacteroidales bacterium]